MAFGGVRVPRHVNRDRARALQLSAVAVLLAGGAVTEAKKSEVLKLVKDEFGYSYSAKTLERDLADGSPDLDELLDKVSYDLDMKGRETLVTAALLVAALDDQVLVSELDVVRTVGWGIGLTKWQVRQVVSLGVRRLRDAGINCPPSA